MNIPIGMITRMRSNFVQDIVSGFGKTSSDALKVGADTYVEGFMLSNSINDINTIFTDIFHDSFSFFIAISLTNELCFERIITIGICIGITIRKHP